MQIRKTKLEDLPQLSKAFDAYRVWYRKTSDIETAKEFLSERIKSNESTIFIAEENDKLLGFTQLYPLFSSTRMKRLWLLNDLFVHKEERGKGISRLLLDAAKQHCIDTNGCGVMLETEKSNEIGNILYPKTDFKMNDSHNFYEWNPE